METESHQKYMERIGAESWLCLYRSPMFQLISVPIGYIAAWNNFKCKSNH